MSRSSSPVGAGVVVSVGGDLRLPADRRPDLVERRARVEEVEAHLAGLVEVPDPEVRDDDRRAAAQPALLAPDPLGLLGPAEVAGRGPEVDPLDEASGRDWRMITKIWRALIAISQAPPRARQARLRVA